MKKTLGILTLTIVVIAGAAMVFAGVTAQKTNATSTLCHTTTLSIKAPSLRGLGQDASRSPALRPRRRSTP